MPGEYVQCLARRVSSGHAFAVGGERRPPLVPPVRQLTAQHAISLVRELRILASILLKLSPPGSMERQAARPDALLEMLTHLIWDEELRFWRPAVGTLRQPDLFLAQRFAVRRTRVLLVRRAVGDVTVDDDQGRSIARALERPERALEHLEIIGVADARDVPPEPDDARGHIIAVRQRRVALDGYVIVVVDPTEVVEFEVSCQRGGLAGDPFHHAAVAAQSVYVVVEQIEPRTIEVAGQPALGDGHADARRQPL